MAYHFSETSGETRRPTAFGASMLFFLTLGLMLTASFLFGGRALEDNSYYLFLFLVQLAIIGVPSLLYMRICRIPMKSSARLNPLPVPEALLIIGMAVFGYLVVILINLLWYWVISHIGPPQPPPLPPVNTGQQYLLALLVVALTPAVFEEILFRGVIQRGYERLGLRFSLVATGILFALLHLSILSLPSIIVLGIVLCYVVYRSNSLYAGILYHFVNNAIAMTFAYLQSAFAGLFPLEDAAESLAELPSETLLAGILAWGVVGFFALGLFAACFAGFMLLTRDRRRPILTQDMPPRPALSEFIPALAAVLIALLLLTFEVLNL